MDKTVGQITIALVLITGLASGAIALDLKGLATIFMGGWTGLTGSGAQVEGLVCDRTGVNCSYKAGD
jgi:hypothetical protein